MKDNSKLKLTLLRIALAVAVLMLAFMASYNVKAMGTMKTADKVAEQASVAGWSIDVSCDKDDENKDKTLAVAYGLDPASNETNYYIAKVNNKSEVAGKYSLVVSDVPAGVKVVCYKGAEETPIKVDPVEAGDKYIFTFTDLEKLSPNQTGSDLKIVFIPTSAVSATETKEVLITFKVDQDNGQA